MSERRLLEIQPDGVVEWFHFDHSSGRMAIEHIQDVSDPDANKKRPIAMTAIRRRASCARSADPPYRS
jgi:hypothetical protein